MSATVKFKEDIISTVQKLESEEPNSTSPARVLREMQEIVREDSNSSKMSTSQFKAEWLRRILAVMEELNVASCSKKNTISEKVWSHLLSESTPSTTTPTTCHTEPSTSASRESTSSLSYQRRICNQDL